MENGVSPSHAQPAGITGIDWSRPWLTHLRPLVPRIEEGIAFRHGLNVQASTIGLKNHQDLPIRFVPQSELPDGMAYETFIYRTGCVPTRDNHHDFFNGLIWLAFPHIKARLNALQAQEIERRRVLECVSSQGGSRRGGLRDAITIFDENAILLAYSDEGIPQALREHQWSDVFENRRTAFGKTWTVLAFGHALIEKLVNPYKAITAHAWAVRVDPSFLTAPVDERVAELDKRVSENLSGTLTTADFFPLPVLGIPGWWSGQDSEFYGDEQVFRPKRLRGKGVLSR